MSRRTKKAAPAALNPSNPSNPKKAAYDYERDFYLPVGDAIVRLMEHKKAKVRGGRYVTQFGDCLGSLSAPITLHAAGEDSIEPVNCTLFAVFSPSLAKIMDEIVNFAAVSYDSAVAFVREREKVGRLEEGADHA